MKYSILTLMFIFTLLNLCAYENTFPNLITPSALNAKDAELVVTHRFDGKVTDHPLDTLFGMKEGTNIGVRLRYAILPGLEAKVGYIDVSNDFQVQGAYRFTPVDFPLEIQADAQLYSYRRSMAESRKSAMMLVSSWQSAPIAKHLLLNANAGYDSRYKRFINGYGVGIITIPTITLYGEFFPVWDRNTAKGNLKRDIATYDIYTVGVKLDYWGHQFTFLLDNGYAQSLRNLTLGSYHTPLLQFGFNIQRQL